ncbi:MAG: hypothetical protein QM652_06155 [Legionella sp.]|uniref:hypothetical protein n=1 Tax=Legionella sp. TaxID=459 RepID=UPI0039E2E8F5
MKGFNENMNEIKQKSNELYDTAKEKATNAYNETKPKAEELAEQIGKTASDLYESGKKGVVQSEENVELYIDSLAQVIRRHPLTSILIAAGIGYLYAKIFK